DLRWSTMCDRTSARCSVVDRLSAPPEPFSLVVRKGTAPIARAAHTEICLFERRLHGPAMTHTSDSAHGSVDDRTARPAPASPTRTVLRLVLLILAVAAGLWLLFALQGVILLLLLSMLFAYLIAPLVEFLCRPVTWRRRRPWAIPRPLAIAMVYLAFFASVGIASYVRLPLLGAQVTDF